MCVGQSRSEYGDDLIRRLKSAAPDALIIDSFLDADALADLFQRTALNVHPPLYDTFGMSVVEAAAFGAPSLLHSGGMVGATVAVRPAHGEALEADLSSLSVGGPATEVEAAREVPATARLSPDSDAAATAAAAAEGVKELVGQMAALLLDLGHLAAVGAAAKARALAYGEADHGAEVVLLPAAFTKTTTDAHWEVLLRARAIENGVHVVAANQDGRDGADRPAGGRSMIVGPWGEVLVECPPGKGFALTDLDPAARHDARKALPIAALRRDQANLDPMRGLEQ